MILHLESSIVMKLALLLLWCLLKFWRRKDPGMNGMGWQGVFMPSVKSLLIPATGWPYLSPLAYNTANGQGQWRYYIVPPTTYYTSTPASGCWSVCPTKEGMEKILQEYKSKQNCKGRQATFPLLLNELWKRMKPEHIVAGF